MAITKANTGALPTPTRKVPMVIALLSWLRNWAGEMSSAAAHIRPPPSSARMSAKNASSGRAIISASTRGRTRTSIGSSPSVRSASTSWLTFMVPIWAVKALPERPAITIAVNRIAISRRIEMPSRLTVKISAPKRRSWSAPW